MHLQTNKNLRVLRNKERIHKKDLVYGMSTDGTVKWCSTRNLKGKKWFKHDPFSPTIVLRHTTTKEKS